MDTNTNLYIDTVEFGKLPKYNYNLYNNEKSEAITDVLCSQAPFDVKRARIMANSITILDIILLIISKRK